MIYLCLNEGVVQESSMTPIQLLCQCSDNTFELSSTETLWVSWLQCDISVSLQTYVSRHARGEHSRLGTTILHCICIVNIPNKKRNQDCRVQVRNPQPSADTTMRLCGAIVNSTNASCSHMQTCTHITHISFFDRLTRLPRHHPGSPPA